MRSAARKRRHDAAGDRDVVVLDQDGVIEPEAVVDAAAAAHRVFFQRAQAGRGLAGAADARLGVGDGVGVMRASGWRCRESRPRKFSAMRSADSSARAGPAIRARTARRRRTASPSREQGLEAEVGIDSSEGVAREGRPASTPACCAPRSRRGPGRAAGMVACEVMSPARPRSSSSAARTASSTSSGMSCGQSHGDAALRNVGGRAPARQAAKRVVQRDDSESVRQRRVGVGGIIGAEMAAAALAPRARRRPRPAARPSPCCAERRYCRAARSMQSAASVARRRASPSPSRITPTWRVMIVRSFCRSASASPDARSSARRTGRAGGRRRAPLAMSRGDAGAEDHRLQQRIGGQPVGAMRRRSRRLRRRPKAGQRGAAARVRPRCRPCGNARPARPGSAARAGSMPAARQVACDGREFVGESRAERLRGVEKRAAAGGDFREDAARDDVARRQFGARDAAPA